MLEINHLYKRFGRTLALNDFSMTVADGELFGFVGANGAGKSTTMRICVGLMKADSGEVYIDGEPMLDNHRKLSSKIGFVPDYFGVYRNFNVMEYMQFFASAYGMYGDEADQLCKDLLTLVKLEHKMDADVNTLSRGMKQRLCMARGLVHDPDILFLDEPASGLDPRARYELKEILRNLSSMGKTIVISSHILPELAEMCTSVGIIDRGHLVIKGTIDEINRAAAMSSPIKLVIDENQIDDAFAVLKECPSVQRVTAQGSHISIVFTGDKEDESKLLADLISHNIAIQSFSRQDGSLEELFMQVVNRRSNRPQGR